MKLKKLKKVLKKANKRLNPKKREDALKIKHLKKLLKKLRKYEHDAMEKREKSKSQKEKDQLKRHILLAHAQRKKALGLMKDLSRKKKK